MIIKSSEKKEKSIVELIIDVSAEEFDKALQSAFIKNRNQIAVPGFRKGKAPRRIIERMYGATIFHSDAMENILPSVLSFIETDSGLKIVGQPSATDFSVNEEEGGVSFTFDVSVYPEVTLGQYKGLSAVKPAIEVADSEIDSEVESVRLRNASFEKADRPAILGDTVIIDYEGFIDGEAFDGGKGEDQELELGSGKFIPGFEDKIQGMTAGEKRDLDLTFPNDYKDDLAGKDVVFKVEVKEIRERILPDLDDEFAKDVSEFDTLDEYRASIRDKILKARQEIADSAFENALMAQVADLLEGDVPDTMVEAQMDEAMNDFARQMQAYGMRPEQYLQMTGTTPADFRETSRKSSERQVKSLLALEKIAEIEAFEVTEEDIENGFDEAAKRFNMELDKIKESVTEEDIIREMKIKKALKVVVDSATALDAPPETEEADGDADDADADAVAELVESVVAEAAESGAASDGAADAEKGDGAAAVAAAGSPKKPAAKKTTAKKPAAKDAETDDAGTAAPQDDAAKAAKPAAKKAAPKKTKTQDEGADAAAVAAEADAVAEESKADAEPAKKPARKPAAKKPKESSEEKSEE